MSIDFSKLQRSEVLTDDVLTSSELADYVNSQINLEKTAAVTLLEQKGLKLTTDKALADEKVEMLQSKLLEIEKNPPNDTDELKKVRAQLANAKEEATIESNAKIKTLGEQLAEAKVETEQVRGKYNTSKVKSFLRNGISEYNAKFPTVKIKDGAESFIVDKLMKTWKNDDQGEIRAFEGDTLLTGSNGFMSVVESLVQTRSDSNAHLFFESPNGSGASGGQVGGAGEKTMTRTAFNAMTDKAEQAKVARSHTLIEG